MRGMGGDAREDIGEPSLRIDAINFRRDNETVYGGSALAAAVGASEQPRFPVPKAIPRSARSAALLKGMVHFDAAFLASVQRLVKVTNRPPGSGRREHETAAGRPYHEL